MHPVEPDHRHPGIPAATDPGRPFQLVHLSDFHLCRAHGAPLTAWASKRALSFLAWHTRRRHENRPAVLSSMIEALVNLSWDHAVVTGDLVHLALPTEYRLARRYLEAIGPPERVLVVPGNHDALVKSPFRQSFALWADFLALDGGPPVFPTLRIRRQVALIGLSSARPTLPFSAAGRLGASQRARLGQILTQTGRRGYFRVVLLHHPLLPGQVSRRKSLTDAAALRALLRRHGAELVLHGHVHRDLQADLPGPTGAIPVLGLPATSAAHRCRERRACLRVFSIRRAGSRWEIAVQDHAYTHTGRIAALPLRLCRVSAATAPAHPAFRSTAP
jgi:3',5'-cyclic AMP phosphodiesterase CpdA